MKHRTLVVAFALAALAAMSFSSPTVLAFAAEEGHEAGWGWLETIGRWINLLILFGVLIYFLRTPFKKFFSGRTTAIADEIKSSAAAYEKARADRTALEAKVSNIDAELAAIRQDAERQAELERERVRDQARKDAERLIDGARREIENFTRAAQKDLREYAAELAVELAEARISREIRPQDERKVVDRFFVSLGQNKSTKG